MIPKAYINEWRTTVLWLTAITGLRMRLTPPLNCSMLMPGGIMPGFRISNLSS